MKRGGGSRKCRCGPGGGWVLSMLLWTWGGTAYFLLEVLYKTAMGEPERISWTMLVLAIFLCVPVERCGAELPWEMPLWLQAAACAALVTAAELAAGLVLNVWLKLGEDRAFTIFIYYITDGVLQDARPGYAQAIYQFLKFFSESVAVNAQCPVRVLFRNYFPSFYQHVESLLGYIPSGGDHLFPTSV